MKTFAVILLCALAFPAFAIPQLINYQGELTRPNGTPLDTTVAMTFRLYGVSSGGTAIWTETRPSITVTDGLFHVMLGSVTTLPDSFAVNRWLGVTVGSNSEMTPRQQVVSVAHAYRVRTIDGAIGGTIAGNVTIDSVRANAVRFGDGTVQNSAFTGLGPLQLDSDTNSFDASRTFVTSQGYVTAANSQQDVDTMFWDATRAWVRSMGYLKGTGNTCDSLCFVGGGSDNAATGLYSSVGGGWHNSAHWFSSVVAGGQDNNAQGSADFIGGGDLNGTSGDGLSVVCGGLLNFSAGESFVGGGAFNSAAGGNSVVCGGSENAAIGFAAAVGGGRQNYAGGLASSVAGGSNNVIVADGGTIGGGFYNRLRGRFSFIGGGGSPDEADSNWVFADTSCIVGGYHNGIEATGRVSFIGGGSHNYSGSNYGVIGGGYSNADTGYACTIGGGANNIAISDYTTIAGGVNNQAYARYATVGGGSACRASGEASTVAGGATNIASGQDAFIGGGYNNVASGFRSIVPGGANNEASSTYGFAAGNNSHAIHSGAFVWGDGWGTNLTSSANEQFSARASGGYRLYTNNSHTSGVTMAAGGNAWVVVSDSTKKRAIRQTDTQAILNKVASLPIKNWEYKSEAEGSNHIGPMAQDFWNAFQLGSDSLGISTIDADGILFAAVQELAKQNAELRAMVQSLMAEKQQTNHILKEEK